MKKSIVAISCMAFMLLFSSAVFAITSVTNGTGGTLTIDLSGGSVPGTTTNFTFDSSPSVGIAVSTTATAYAITTANSLTGADNNNGQEYGTLSTASGYAQRDKVTNANAGPTVTTSETALPAGGDWAWMGGS